MAFAAPPARERAGRAPRGRGRSPSGRWRAASTPRRPRPGRRARGRSRGRAVSGPWSRHCRAPRYRSPFFGGIIGAPSRRRSPMASQKRVGVVLSGCGFLDGAEIQEATCTLLSLDRRGAKLVALAPDVEQMHVVDHLESAPVEGEKRRVLAEAARIVR